MSKDGNLVLSPPQGGTVLVNGTDLLSLLSSVQHLRSEMAALQEENRRLNSTVVRLEARIEGGGGGGREQNATHLPGDIGAYTDIAIKVTGAGNGDVNGYYAKLPGNCNGKVCYTKVVGSQVLIAWRKAGCDFSGCYGTNGWTFSYFVWNGFAGDRSKIDSAVLYTSASATTTPPQTGWSGTGDTPTVAFL